VISAFKIFSIYPFLPLREKTKVSGAIKSFSLHRTSPLAGEGQGEGFFEKVFRSSLLSPCGRKLK